MDVAEKQELAATTKQNGNLFIYINYIKKMGENQIWVKFLLTYTTMVW